MGTCVPQRTWHNPNLKLWVILRPEWNLASDLPVLLLLLLFFFITVVSGYTQEEKVEIAHRHLIPNQLEQHGLTPQQLHIPQSTTPDIISRYNLTQTQSSSPKTVRLHSRLSFMLTAAHSGISVRYWWWNTLKHVWIFNNEIVREMICSVTVDLWEWLL